MSCNTWKVLKDDLFKYVETSIKLFICYVIQQMLFPGSLGGHLVVCWRQKLSEYLSKNNCTGT